MNGGGTGRKHLMYLYINNNLSITHDRKMLAALNLKSVNYVYMFMVILPLLLPIFSLPIRQVNPTNQLG